VRKRWLSRSIAHTKEKAMKKFEQLALAGILACSATGVLADDPPVTAPPLKQRSMQVCERCGTVEHVRQEKRKGEGGAAGIVGGAVVGGLLGNQIGKGSGRAVATVGGAVVGGYAGNEVQKNVNSKQVWVTQVRMRDGSVRHFEQEAAPRWKAGSVVRLNGNNQLRLAGTT
jgi:outer membrane lipoprotein SlyB